MKAHQDYGLKEDLLVLSQQPGNQVQQTLAIRRELSLERRLPSDDVCVNIRGCIIWVLCSSRNCPKFSRLCLGRSGYGECSHLAALGVFCVVDFDCALKSIIDGNRGLKAITNVMNNCCPAIRT
jgi:hypothetical protein